MSRKIHRILLALVVVIMGSCFLLSEKEANAYTTKAQIRKSIKKYTYLEKKVKKEAISAKKSYQKYSKQSGKARNGSIVIFMGKIVIQIHAWCMLGISIFIFKIRKEVQELGELLPEV